MKKSFSLFAAVLGVLSLAPIAAFAQNAQGVLTTIIDLINTIITILIIAAIAYFIYTVVKYIMGKGKSEEIVNGLIGLFVIVAFWGIIRIVQNTFGLDDSNQIQIQDVPCIQGIPQVEGGC